MRVLDLFSGTGCISNVFREAGHTVCSVDYDTQFKNTTICTDVELLTSDQIIKALGGYPDIIWASPDCTTYSIAGISHHRRQSINSLEPISDYAKKCDRVNKHMLELIKELNPKYYFIENPRGGMRKMYFMQDLPRYTITYCQYGDTRMKPTDIWTNYPNPNFKPMCHNGDNCHVSAPRGSSTPGSTKGLKNHVERSKIPEEFCKYILKLCEDKI